MADTKISALPTKATPVSADIIPIVDSVGTVNRKVTAGTLPISTATQTALNAKQDSLGFTPANKAGDTFTGNISIIKGSGSADFTLDAPLSTDNKDISFKTGGLHRFIARVDGATDDFTLRRHDDLGAHIDNPITVSRSTGNVSIPVATTTTQTQGDNSTKIATTEYVDSASKCIIRAYQTTDNWVKPSGLKAVFVELGGGGGGGGGGRRGAAGSVRCGGGGGAGGAVVRGWFKDTELPSSLTITIGAGGVSGSSALTDNANGGNAGAGGTTTFGSLLRAVGGGGGSGGTATSGAGGSSTFTTATPDNFGQKAGQSASGSGGVGSAGTQSLDVSAPSGASGGGISSSDVLSGGGAGGSRSAGSYRAGFQASGGSAGTSGAGAGGNAGDGGNATATYFGLVVGAGGGGGGSRSGADGGNGGNGTGFGSGGGGGAGSENGFNSGRGGSGGNGYALVFEYY